jgi:hypothetical protein
MTPDPEFIKILTRVVIVGTAIGGTGALALYYVMRALRGEEFKGALLIGVLLAFVFVCCAVLLVVSFTK